MFKKPCADCTFRSDIHFRGLTQEKAESIVRSRSARRNISLPQNYDF